MNLPNFFGKISLKFIKIFKFRKLNLFGSAGELKGSLRELKGRYFAGGKSFVLLTSLPFFSIDSVELKFPFHSAQTRCQSEGAFYCICQNGFVACCRGVLNRLLKIERKLRQLFAFTNIINFSCQSYHNTLCADI